MRSSESKRGVEIVESITICFVFSVKTRRRMTTVGSMFSNIKITAWTSQAQPRLPFFRFIRICIFYVTGLPLWTSVTWVCPRDTQTSCDFDILHFGQDQDIHPFPRLI